MTFPPLRSVKVHFNDGNHLVTNMAAGLSDEEIRNYYAIGRSFNLGIVENNMAQVTKVVILA